MYYNNTPYSLDDTEKSSNSRSNSSKNELMCKIQQASFAAYDLQLYLDTHPDCKEALELYTKLNATVASLRQDFENSYGPLKAYSSPDDVPFRWADECYEWPWAKVKEV